MSKLQAPRIRDRVAIHSIATSHTRRVSLCFGRTELFFQQQNLVAFDRAGAVTARDDSFHTMSQRRSLYSWRNPKHIHFTDYASFTVALLQALLAGMREVRQELINYEDKY